MNLVAPYVMRRSRAISTMDQPSRPLSFSGRQTMAVLHRSMTHVAELGQPSVSHLAHSNLPELVLWLSRLNASL